MRSNVLRGDAKCGVSPRRSVLRVVKGSEAQGAPAAREAFPSARQARAAGLKRNYYPEYLREFVDYDYDEALPDAARVWLAAFTEEYYRGWRLKKETQIHSLEHLREAGAQRKRRREHQDPAAWGAHRGSSTAPCEAGRADQEDTMIAALDRWRR